MDEKPKQREATKIRLDPDIEEEVWFKTIKVKTSLNRVVNAMLRAWVASDAAAPAQIEAPKDTPDLLDTLLSIASDADRLKRRVLDAASTIKEATSDNGRHFSNARAVDDRGDGQGGPLQEAARNARRADRLAEERPEASDSREAHHEGDTRKTKRVKKSR